MRNGALGRVATSEGSAAVRDLRRARRRRAYGDMDWSDALYKVYVTAILSALAVSLISGWLGGRPVTPTELATAVRRGPALVGLVVAVAIGAGLRSGGRGGPLALEPADVQLLLLAPVARTVALRGPAARHLRFGAFVGAVTGMTAGNLAAQRLPGPYGTWVAAGGVAGLVTGMAWTGSALMASGFRMGRRWAGVLAVVVVGWSVGDLVKSTATSPATVLGRLAMSGIDAVPAGPLGLALLALPLAGLAGVGGTSLEAARRQAGLVTELRFAVTMQDVRTVILLRRQLAAEGPRRQPWVRLPAGRRSYPVWRRDWQGVLRWPAARVLRVTLLGGAAGLAAAGAWRDTPALIVAAAAAMLLAALDSVEGMAQEADHLIRRDTLPVGAGRLLSLHLAAPTAVMVAVAVVAVGSAAAWGGATTVLAVGPVLAVPAVLAAVCGAALSIETGPVDPYRVELFAGARLAIRSVGPFILAVIGVLPLLEARAAANAGRPAAAGAASGSLAVLMVVAAVGAWLRRER